jgi:hypothetical protein
MTDARSEAGDAAAPRLAPGRRRTRQPSSRRHRVEFSLTDAEFAALCEAAGQAGLARGAYAAGATVGAALGRGDGGPGQQKLLQDALAGLSRCAIAVGRVGVNLNQSVAKLNATGQADANLVLYAAEAVRLAGYLGEAAAEVRRAVLRAVPR